MAEIRRGYAMLLTVGDEQISKALADGILAVRLPMANSLSQPTADSFARRETAPFCLLRRHFPRLAGESPQRGSLTAITADSVSL